jgi:hypothetical protein
MCDKHSSFEENSIKQYRHFVLSLTSSTLSAKLLLVLQLEVVWIIIVRLLLVLKLIIVISILGVLQLVSLFETIGLRLQQKTFEVANIEREVLQLEVVWIIIVRLLVVLQLEVVRIIIVRLLVVLQLEVVVVLLVLLFWCCCSRLAGVVVRDHRTQIAAENFRSG